LNGTGKTNLLDAIYYLCFTKSYFSKPDIQSVFQNLQGFRIDGTIESKNEKEKIVCILRENNKKEFYLNDIQYKRFSKHIGKFTCVFIAPDDVQLITEGSETRRNFVDAIISQFDPSYLQYLIDYKKILEERNSLLKAAFEKDYLDQTLLNILDEQLIKNGNKIFDTRKLFLTSYIPEVLKSYTEIAGKDENIQLSYYSQLTNAPFEELLQQNLQKIFIYKEQVLGYIKMILKLL
jgi:DNA replication and repair protein RecF